MGKKNETHPGVRDGRTGRYTKEGMEKRDPDRYNKESIPNPGRGDTGRGGSGRGSGGSGGKKKK